MTGVTPMHLGVPKSMVISMGTASLIEHSY